MIDPAQLAASAVNLAQGETQLRGEETLLLGEDFLPWMVLAFGAAMVVGNVFALLRPPADAADPSDPADPAAQEAPSDGRPPLGRAVVLILIGAVAALWGLASLLG